jgi:hypothetical protein
VIVTGFIGLLNVALTTAFNGTFIAPLAGLVRVIVGEVVSGPVPVVKLHT